ncbi:MAG: diguanylate cyclase [Acidobacteriota bacterium]|nr:diguanylate cyclase [Acidobacteriota bacterium]
MDHQSTPVVPADRLLEVAGALSQGAARLHEELRHLPPEQRDALLEIVLDQVGDIVAAWSALVRAVVSVDVDRQTAPLPAPQAPRRTAPAGGVPPEAQTPPPAGEPPTGQPPAASPGDALRTGNGGPPEWERTVQPPPSVPPPPPPPAAVTPLTAVRGPTLVEQQPSAETLVEPTDRLTRDELTGSLNRQAGFTALAREVDRSLGEGTGLVLGYLNVDGLRHVNDTAGPRAGDELLRKVAAALRATLRSYDMVMRLAGDEFLFALPSADLATAEQRLREFTVILNEEAPGASASVGFAELRQGDSVDDLVARADDALVEARRRRGRPRLR